MDYDMERRLLFELHEMNKNLTKINESIEKFNKIFLDAADETENN